MSMQGKWTLFFFWLRVSVLLVVSTALVVVGVLVAREFRSSTYQAQFFYDLARKATFSLDEGPSSSIRFPASAPYDDRLGYSKLPVFIDKLKARNFSVTQQARISEGMSELLDAGFFAPYPEKIQSGLTIQDCRKDTLFQESYPGRVFARFEDLAPELVHSLLFIENRELLDPSNPKRNPAVEWDRLAHAVAIKAQNLITGQGNAPGGSTLATQIEKYRHSSEGRTSSVIEKLQQMVSASLRAYQQGEDTTEARRQIVLTYLNTMPLSAKVGFGEVHGIGDGLWAWYGRDFSEVSRILKDAAEGQEDLLKMGLLYKQALSLLISQRRPSYYFDAPEAELESLADSHLRLLATAEVISPALRDAALKAKLNRRTGRVPSPDVSFVTQKAANAVRTHLTGLMGGNFYDLDRLDLNVASTLNAPVQATVATLLQSLRDPAQAEALGLNNKQLLARGDPAGVVYSFTLYERGVDRNYLRVQTDNYDQPLNINEGTKLDLGSTAKLRTLITYLDVIAKLHGRLSVLDSAALKAQEIDPKDVLSSWAVDYLMRAKDRSLKSMLDAAMERTYSGSTAESFFTGGGMHTFANFNKADDSRVMTLREGLRSSVNLVFIRLMRDIVRHYMFLTPGSSAKLLQDADDPRRADYLARFADREGQIFMRRFLGKYQGKTEKEAQQILLESVRPTTSRLAAIFRTIAPTATVAQLSDFVMSNLPHDQEVSGDRLSRLYAQYDPATMSLADRGYLATIHPLELWLVGYLRSHPDATQTQVMEASVDERQAVYSWLFSTHRKHAQDKRILVLLEGEGFLEIHRQWAKMGYPFSSLVPSYATSLGASADRPAALAEMMGILVNGGVHKPNTRIETMYFATATPYETRLTYQGSEGEAVLAPEVAQAALAAAREVVDSGTAKRVRDAFVRPDGSHFAVGGKTGTGDQRFDTYGAGGRLLESRVVNRSATFVFNIDERFFGTMIAYVPGSKAADYGFTSGLPVQLLKVLAPSLMPLIAGTPAAEGQPGGCTPGSSRK
jgi:membrane peptidoglycan carboxypeptidase